MLEFLKHRVKDGKIAIEDGVAPIQVLDNRKDTNPNMFRPEGFMRYHLLTDQLGGESHTFLRFDKNCILFKLQDGPIKEVGVNGCQIDFILNVVMALLQGANEKFPHAENEKAMDHIMKAWQALQRRTKERTERGVEGYEKP